MKKFYIKRLISIFIYGLLMVLNLLASLSNAYNQITFICFMSTIITLILYYIFIYEIKNFAKVLYIKNNIQSINIYFDDRTKVISFSLNLSKEAKKTINLKHIIEKSETISFIKILNENTQTSLFYNNSKEDSTLKNALEKIEVLKK